MSEEGPSWGESFSQLKKIHPVILILVIVGTTLTSWIFSQNMPLENKLLPIILSFALCLLTVLFESYRIGKESELREKAWRRRVFG